MNEGPTMLIHDIVLCHDAFATEAALQQERDEQSRLEAPKYLQFAAALR